VQISPELVAEFYAEGGLGGGRSPSAFRRWLKKKYGISIGSKKANRALKEFQPEWVIENRWEALGPDGKVVELAQRKVKLKHEVDWREAIRKFIAEESQPVDIRATPRGELVGVLSIPDVHVGKLAWEPEVGEAYDTKRAVAVYLDAVRELAGRLKAAGVGRVLYVVGNDLLHVDGGLFPATTKGTIQDTDTRWQYAFRRAKAMIASSIEALAEFAEVDVVVAPGNHDRVLSWALGEVLVAYFSHAEGIRVNNEPRYRKYATYGKLLFGITHGDQVKPNALPTLMATEVPELWGQTTHREWLLGHVHRKREFLSVAVDEHNGVRLRYLPSLAAVDRWHYEMGYSAIRSAEAHVYDPERGEQVASYYHRVG